MENNQEESSRREKEVGQEAGRLAFWLSVKKKKKEERKDDEEEEMEKRKRWVRIKDFKRRFGIRDVSLAKRPILK